MSIAIDNGLMAEVNERDPLPGVPDAALFRLLEPVVEARFRRDPKGAYEIRVFMASAEVKSLFEELEGTLDLLSRAATFSQLTALLKLYIVSWHSASDLLAIVVNEAYDLGMAEQDVSLGALLRNAHIRQSELPAIVKRHAIAIRYNHFVKMRNDIVHRGTLDDEELDKIQHDFLMGIVNRATPDLANDEQKKREVVRAARSEAGTPQRIQTLVNARKSEYAGHLRATRAFLAEIAAAIVDRVRRQPL